MHDIVNSASSLTSLDTSLSALHPNHVNSAIVYEKSVASSDMSSHHWQLNLNV